MIDSGIWRNVPFPLNLPLKIIVKGFFKVGFTITYLRSCVPTHSLTRSFSPRSKVKNSSRNPTVLQTTKLLHDSLPKNPSLYLPWATQSPSSPSHPVPLRSRLIFSAHVMQVCPHPRSQFTFLLISRLTADTELRRVETINSASQPVTNSDIPGKEFSRKSLSS